MGWVTMVKRIKRAQKDLVVTTSPRCYWSIRVNLYEVASFVSVLRCYFRSRNMSKRMQRTDFNQCEESKRRKATADQQIDHNLSTSSVEEDLVCMLYYLVTLCSFFVTYSFPHCTLTFSPTTL